MSHHRETVHAEGAPAAAGPYSHAVISNGLIFLSGQTPIDPATGQLVEGSVGDQARRCLDNLASSRPPPARSSPTPCASAST
jgi:2-iminobutanoate/2-iminopropanoate deaminase